MKPRRPAKKWCRVCDKVRRCDVVRDKDAWTCRTCKAQTSGLQEVQLRYPPGEVKG